MSQTQSAEEVRTFLARKICQQMRDGDVTGLKFIYQLNLTSQDPRHVLAKLEEAGKFSSVDNLKPLATMMERIGRKDLANEIEQFITKNLKSRKSYKSNTHDYSTLLLIFELTASLQAIQPTIAHLLNQLETIKERIPNDTMFYEVGKAITKAITYLEEKLQPKISAATRALPQPKVDSTDSSSSDDNSDHEYAGFTGSNEIQSRPLPDLPTPSAHKSQKLPIEEETQPDDEDDDDEDYERLPIDQSIIEPIQQEEVRDLRDQPAKTEPEVEPLPPQVPPRHKKLQKKRTYKIVSAGCSHTQLHQPQQPIGESTGSGSDSGFIDSCLLQRDSSSPHHKVAANDQQSRLYTKLNTEQLDPVAPYTAVNTTMSTLTSIKQTSND